MERVILDNLDAMGDSSHGETSLTQGANHENDSDLHRGPAHAFGLRFQRKNHRGARAPRRGELDAARHSVTGYGQRGVAMQTRVRQPHPQLLLVAAKLTVKLYFALVHWCYGALTPSDNAEPMLGFMPLLMPATTIVLEARPRKIIASPGARLMGVVVAA
jgi:hypothetical protein